MSKKLYSTNAWKERSRRRQEDQLRNLRRRRSAKRGLRRERARKKLLRKSGYTVLKPPTVFSLVRNPEEFIEFLRSVRSQARYSHLAFDLREITVMTSDAVAAFAATLRDLSTTNVRGNLPLNEEAKQMLLQSGFFDHVESVERLPSATRGRISQLQSKRVEPVFAKDLIHKGTAAVFGVFKHQPASYRVLIESMTNTRNHAAESVGEKQEWWATVYADLSSQHVCYTILDMGVGIFRSIKIRWLRRLYRAIGHSIGITDDSDILKQILRGEVESSTGQKYRGKGLPAIYNLAQTQRIKALIIIANNVYANVSTGQFRLLPGAFNGTLLYWEN
jgi:hypothetical protein